MKRAIQIVVGLVVAVAAAGTVSLLVADPASVVKERQDALVAQASEELGRGLSVGAVDARIFPDLSATVHDVRLAGATADGPPQLVVREIEVGFSLWKALLSLGSTLEVQNMSVRGLELRAARDAEGRWDFQDILDKQADQPDTGEPTDLAFLEGASIARAAIEDATIEIDDAALGRPLKVTGVSLALEDIRLGEALDVVLRATFEDGGKKAPLAISVNLAELPRDLSFKPLPTIVAQVKVDDLAVGPWGALLRAETVAPVEGALAVDVTLDLSHDGSDVSLKDAARAKGLVLEHKTQRGKPLDLDTKLDVAYLVTEDKLAVRALEVAGTGIELHAELDASPMSLAGVSKAAVDAKVADIGRLLAVFPRGVLDLPEELLLEGPLVASATGNADALQLTVNVDGAHVAWAESFDKAKGRPLHISLQGKRAGERLVIDPFELVVDKAVIGGSIALPRVAGAPVEASLSSGAVSLASLQEIVPPFKKALARGDKVAGTVGFEAKAKAVSGKQQFLAELKLRDMDVNLQGATARGEGKVKIDVIPTGDAVDLKVVADLARIALTSRDKSGAPVLNKPAGMPLDLDVHVVQSSKRADVKKALLRIGATTVKGTGEATALDTDNAKLAFDLGALDVAFDDLRRALPGAALLPAGGHLKGRVKLAGQPTALSTMIVDASALDIVIGSSHLRGDVRVEGLEQPKLDVALADSDVRFDDLRSLSESLEVLPAGGRFAGGLGIQGDTARLSTMTAKLDAKALVVRGNELRGSFELVDFDSPNFSFDLRGDDIDVDELLAAFGGETEPSAKKKDNNKHGLGGAARDSLRKVSGTGKLSAKRVVYRGFPMQDFVGDLVMKRGRISFDALDFSLYGGRVSAAGTVFDLPATYTGYELKLNIEKMDLGKALAAHTGVGQIFSGVVSQGVHVSGRGLAKEDVASTLTGPVKLTTDSISIATLDLLGPILAPVAKALIKTPGAPRLSASATKAEKGTTLRDLTAWLNFGDGRMKLDKVLKSKTSFGALSLDGGAKLDNTLDLTATAEISPATIARWTGGKVKPSKSIPVPLKIGGTWARPVVTGVDAGAVIAAIVGGAAAAVLGDVTGEAEAKLDATKAKADATAKKAKADAERAALDAKKKAEAEAKKRAGDAKKMAAAEAKKAKDKAERAAKKKAADAKKKAERAAKKAKDKAAREAKKKAEEARKKLLGF